MFYYAVRNGRSPGIYDNWEDCKDQVHGFSRAEFRKFDSFADAERYLGYSTYDDFNVDENGYVEVYTDGACTKNHVRYADRKAGIGVWFADNCEWNVSRPVQGRKTNNSAEIEAATEAARQAVRADISKLKIIVDSKFLFNCATKWMPVWKRNGWRNAEDNLVKNKQELLELDDAISDLHVTWKHVYAHQGVYGNERAHQLATDACDY